MISAELETLRTAVRQDDRVAVMASIERLDTAFERDRIEYQRFDTMAALLEQRADRSDDDVTDEYREAITELEQRRIEVDRATLAYVEGEDPARTVIESADVVEKAYQRLERQTEALRTAVSDVSIPAVLVVSGDPDIEIPKGTTANGELTLFNIGSSHPDSIAVDVEGDITAKVTPSSITGFDKDGTEVLRVELSPAAAGEFDVVITVTGDGTADRFRFAVLVLSKHAYVNRISRLLGSFEMTLESIEEGKRQNGLENRVRTLRRQLESISADLEDQHRPIRSIDNRLNVA